MERVPMNLTILPVRLNIGAINGDISLFTHPLLSQFFFADRDENSFFCVTKTEHEFSLVMETTSMNELEVFARENGLEDSFSIWPQNWIALRTDLGSSEGEGSVVLSLAKPLSEANITIFYLSTYSSDYCLVEEHNVEKALSVLRKDYPYTVDGEKRFFEEIKSTGSEHSLETCSSSLGAPEESIDSETKRKIFFHDADLHLALITPKHIPQLALFLVKSFFYDCSKTARIISYVRIEQEVSLMADRRYFQNLPASAISAMSIYSEAWKSFSIGDQPLGYSESGIVFSIASPLAKETNLFYMSTFRTDYCLVSIPEADSAIQILKEHFIVESKMEAK